MAAMSLSSALFFAVSSYFVWNYRAELRALAWPRAYLWASGAVFAAAVLSLILARIDPPLGIPNAGALELRKLRYFLLPVLVGWAVHRLTREQGVALENHRIWKVLFGMTALIALVACVQYWSIDLFSPEFLKAHDHFFRVAVWGKHAHGQGFMGFHLSFASAMCFSFAYAFARFLWTNPRRKIAAFAAYAALTALTAVAVVFSYSRIAVLALLATAVLLVGFRKPRWTLGALVGLLGLFAVVWFASPDLRLRFLDRPGWNERAQLYRNAWGMFVDRPWSGVGFAKSGQYADAYAERLYGVNTAFGSHAHNNLLDALATTGIPGGLAYLAWWLVLLCYSVRSYQRAKAGEQWLPAALFAAGIAFQVNGLTQVNFYDAKSQHALVLWAGLILALRIREGNLSRGVRKAA